MVRQVAVGGSLLGKHSLGYFKVVMCHAAHGPVYTRLSLHKPDHIMNGYRGPQLSIKGVSETWTQGWGEYMN